MGSTVEVRNAFQLALAGEPQRLPPIWLMRQAGRYHRPYQELRQRHRFEDLCRIPSLAAEVALGPVRDFDFDAAILFSDLLFPLEALGMSLSYDAGPPKLDGPLDHDRITRFAPLAEAAGRMRFPLRPRIIHREASGGGRQGSSPNDARCILSPRGGAARRARHPSSIRSRHGQRQDNRRSASRQLHR